MSPFWGEMHQPSVAFDFVEEIAALGSADAVLAAFVDRVGSLGFPAVALGELPGPGTRALNAFFVSNWNPALAEAYVGEGYVAHDPSIETARSTVLPIMWSDLEVRWRAAGRNAAPFQFTAAHGFSEGMVIPVHGPDGYQGMVTLLGGAGGIGARERAAIHLMALYLHDRLKALLAPHLAGPTEALPRLSPGELECLKWLVAGKSDWEMSEILGISEATAHRRTERAKAKFGVKTRAQLAALAVHHRYVRM